MVLIPLPLERTPGSQAKELFRPCPYPKEWAFGI